MSRSIDPRRPYKLDDTSCVNEVPRVRVLQEHVRRRKQIRDEKNRAYETAKGELLQIFGSNFRRAADELPRAGHQAQKHVKACEKQSKKANQRYQRAQREFRNEWQRQRNRLVRENLERYKNERPVIDSERQLSGKLVDEEVMCALERTGYMTPQHMLLIDTILTMPGSTVEKEYQRRISAINAIIAFCDVEEGSPTRRPNVSQKRRADNTPPSTPPPKRQEPCAVVEHETELQSAISSVCVKSPDERPTICFLCVTNSKLPIIERFRKHTTPGSLSRHFVDKHVKRFPKDMRLTCNICNKELEHKKHVMNHAQTVHGIVSRRPLAALGPI